jgi:hypothetical protein
MKKKQVSLEGIDVPVDMPDATPTLPEPEPTPPEPEQPDETEIAAEPVKEPAAPVTPPEPTMRELSEKIDAIRQPAKEPEAKQPDPIDLDAEMAAYDTLVAKLDDEAADPFETQKEVARQWAKVQRGMAETLKPARELVRERNEQSQFDAYFKQWGKNDADPISKEFAPVPADEAKKLWLEEVETAKADPYNRTAEAITASARTAWRHRLKGYAPADGDEPTPGKLRSTRTDVTRITAPSGDVHRPTPPAKESAAQKAEKMLGPVHEMTFDR